MENPQFHFRVRVGDVEVEASGPEQYVKEMKEYADKLVSTSLTRLRTYGALPQPKESPSSTPSEPSKPLSSSSGGTLEKDESIVEFLERVPNKTHPDKILAFAYYLEKARSMPSFGVKEISECYDEAKEAKSNTAQYFFLLSKSGLIMKAKNQPGGATQYVLTRKGEGTIKKALTGSQSE